MPVPQTPPLLPESALGLGVAGATVGVSKKPGGKGVKLGVARKVGTLRVGVSATGGTYKGIRVGVEVIVGEGRGVGLGGISVGGRVGVGVAVVA